MTLDTLIMLGGAFVSVLPFLGFPNSWDRVFLLLAGVFIIALGIVVRHRLPGQQAGIGHGVSSQRERKEEFVENVP